MVFPPSNIPAPEDSGIDNGTLYTADTPMAAKQAAITSRRHRWFDIRTIGDQQSPYQVGAAGLSSGGLQRFMFDQRPDWIIISISGQTAATGRARFYLGDEGGPSILLGPHGKACVPAPLGGIVSLRNVGSTATYGNVVAVAGYTDPGVDILCGD